VSVALPQYHLRWILDVGTIMWRRTGTSTVSAARRAVTGRGYEWLLHPELVQAIGPRLQRL